MTAPTFLPRRVTVGVVAEPAVSVASVVSVGRESVLVTVVPFGGAGGE